MIGEFDMSGVDSDGVDTLQRAFFLVFGEAERRSLCANSRINAARLENER